MYNGPFSFFTHAIILPIARDTTTKGTG